MVTRVRARCCDASLRQSAESPRRVLSHRVLQASQTRLIRGLDAHTLVGHASVSVAPPPPTWAGDAATAAAAVAAAAAAAAPPSPTAEPPQPPRPFWLSILASDPVPPGYYLASCEGASEASATVLALTLYRDICAVVGGTVRGPTVASPYAVPTAAIECVSTGGESSAPPHAVTCRIVTLPDDDSADLPPPPLPRAAPPPLSLTDLIVVRRPAPRQPAPPPQRSLRQPQHGVSGGGGGGGRAPPAPTHGGADDDGALLPPLELPDGYRAITCREALVHMAAIVELLQPGDMCRVGDGSLVQHGETVSSACPDPREPEDRTYSCVIGVRGAAPPPPMHNTEPLSPLPEALLVALEGTAAVKAWRLGRGFLVYVGAGVVPEAAVFPMASDRPDRAVWRQLMLSIAHIVEQAEDEE